MEDNVTGKSALNAVQNSLDDVIIELLEPELILPEFQMDDKISVRAKRPRFNEADAKAAAQIKIASQEKVPKNNVQIGGMQLVYVPFWVFAVELEEDNTITLRLNAVSGEFEEEEGESAEGEEEREEGPIPYRGKTKSELVGETLHELQSPSGWFAYLKQFAENVILLLTPNKEHPNRWLTILILIIIALVLLGVGFIQLPTPK